MKYSLLVRPIILSVILSALYLLLLPLFNAEISLTSSTILWGLVSSLLVVFTLTIYSQNSSLRGIKLAISLFIIYFGIGQFNILIEAYIFNVTDRLKTLNEITHGFLIILVFAPIFVLAMNKWKGLSVKSNFKKRSFFDWFWRIGLGMLMYLIFYIAAGMTLQATYPKLMEFYADKIPPIDVMILTQFPRGLIFTLVAILILRTIQLSKIKKILFIGLVFSILGAIAPLVPPNELMPQNIRMVHGVEVGISNFIYGIILGLLINPKILVETMPKNENNSE